MSELDHATVREVPPTLPECATDVVCFRHLLGKKSWNVYNTDNIARVRRDEAEARKRDAEQEKRARDNEADDRLDQLRTQKEGGISRKRRRLDGEDDTDRDIRLAEIAHSENQIKLFDPATLLDPSQSSSKAHQGTQDSRRTKITSDPEGVRLTDAAGRGDNGLKPWYNSAAPIGADADKGMSKDVWGNDDPRRIMREQQRLDKTDPLAAMKRGVKQLRESEARRKDWIDQRERDLHEVELLARKARREKRHRREDGYSSEKESLDNFNLDDGYSGGHSDKAKEPPDRRHRHRHRHHRHHRHHHHGKRRSQLEERQGHRERSRSSHRREDEESH